MSIIEKVTALIGPTSHRAQIETLIEMCQEEAAQYCNLETYSEKLDNAVVQMVLERYNRLNNEGISSTASSGIDESFLDGYSKSTLSMLNKNRKVKVIR